MTILVLFLELRTNEAFKRQKKKKKKHKKVLTRDLET